MRYLWPFTSRESEALIREAYLTLMDGLCDLGMAVSDANGKSHRAETSQNASGSDRK